MADEPSPSPAEQVKHLYEESETRTARAFEELVSRDSFGEVLARVTENVVALTKLGSDAFDLVLRNLRLAGRQDITRLARQLARTEDKLELLLQEVERIQDQLEDSQGSRSRSNRSSSSSNRSSASNGRTGARSRSGARSSRGGSGRS